MSAEEPSHRLWQEAFADLSEGAAPRDDCPEPDRIWAAASGEGSAPERQEVVEHLATCPSCAAAFRLARGLARSDGEPSEEPHAGGVVVPFTASGARTAKRRGLDAPPSARGGWLRWGASIAAVLTLAAILVPRTLWNGSSPYRGAEPSGIRSLLPDEGRLTRNDPELRWTPGPPGSRYLLRVLTQQGREVVYEPDLAAPRYRLPDAAIASLPPGSYLSWQVERFGPDGSRLVSRTFSARLP